MKPSTTNFRNSFQKQSNLQRSKTNSVGVWVDRASLLPCAESHPSKIHFDSWLELKIYQHLIGCFGVEGVIRQQTITVADLLDIGLTLTYTPDFFIPQEQRYIEAKGAWINQDNCKAEKSLFIWQYAVCSQLLYLDIDVVSDSAFMVGKIPVSHFSVIQ